MVLSMAMNEPCAPESCSSVARRAAALQDVAEMDIDDVAGLDEGVAEALAGPLPVGGEKDDLAGADAGDDFKG